MRHDLVDRLTNNGNRNPMKMDSKLNRRKALKTIGSGILGTTALTGSAAANDRSDKETIIMQAHQFQPRQAKVSLGGQGGKTTVEWINRDDVNYYGFDDPPVPHQVEVHAPDGTKVDSTIYYDGDGLHTALIPGDSYAIEFEEDTSTGELIINEVTDEATNFGNPVYPTGSPDETKRIDFDGSVTFHTHCIIHTRDTSEQPGPFGTMEGTLKVSR